MKVLDRLWKADVGVGVGRTGTKVVAVGRLDVALLARLVEAPGPTSPEDDSAAVAAAASTNGLCRVVESGAILGV